MLRTQIQNYKPQSAQEERDKALVLELIDEFGDMLLSRECRAAHFTGSGLILSAELDRCLFAYHCIYDAWGWTGGHADGDGDFLRVALREAQEETGLTHVFAYSGEIASLDILPVYGHWKNGSYVSAHLHLNVAYLLTADPRQSIRPKADENTAVRWIPLNEMDAYCREAHMLPIYRKMLGGLGKK